METFTPVLPKGRVGTVFRFVARWGVLVEAFDEDINGDIIDPIPTAPAVFKKFLRDQHFLCLVILLTSLSLFKIAYNVIDTKF